VTISFRTLPSGPKDKICDVADFLAIRAKSLGPISFLTLHPARPDSSSFHVRMSIASAAPAGAARTIKAAVNAVISLLHRSLHFIVSPIAVVLSLTGDLPLGTGSRVVRPITFSVVMPMQFCFVITRDRSFVRVFGPLFDCFTSQVDKDF